MLLTGMLIYLHWIVGVHTRAEEKRWSVVRFRSILLKSLLQEEYPAHTEQRK